MTSAPSLTGKELLSALKKAGFVLLRVKGSHHFLHHHDGRSTVVPVDRAKGDRFIYSPQKGTDLFIPHFDQLSGFGGNGKYIYLHLPR